MIPFEWTPKVGEERAMLRSVLELTEVDVDEIMTHRKNVSAKSIGQAKARGEGATVRRSAAVTILGLLGGFAYVSGAVLGM